MAAALHLPTVALRQNSHISSKDARALNFLPWRRSRQNKQERMKTAGKRISVQKIKGKKFGSQTRHPSVVASAMYDDDLRSSPPSSGQMIKHFYKCINEQNLKQLGDYISEDCYFEECSFPSPFNGKEEVMNFFDLLIKGMGRNVKFSIEHVCEGENLTAGVNWHLEWNENAVPLTRGCSFFECSEEAERMVIKRARVVIESPIKPGGIVLVLLKEVTRIFDDFPKATEWFLKSQHIILHFLLKIYTIIVTTFVDPILQFYLNIWKGMAQLLAFAIKIMLHIAKILFK